MKFLQCLLEITANFAAVATGIIAILFWARAKSEQTEKISRLENHLRAEKQNSADKGQRSIPHLVAHLGMSESDIFDAAFRSKHVKRITTRMKRASRQK